MGNAPNLLRTFIIHTRGDTIYFTRWLLRRMSHFQKQYLLQYLGGHSIPFVCIFMQLLKWISNNNFKSSIVIEKYCDFQNMIYPVVGVNHQQPLQWNSIRWWIKITFIRWVTVRKKIKVKWHLNTEVHYSLSRWSENWLNYCESYTCVFLSSWSPELFPLMIMQLNNNQRVHLLI